MPQNYHPWDDSDLHAVAADNDSAPADDNETHLVAVDDVASVGNGSVAADDVLNLHVDTVAFDVDEFPADIAAAVAGMDPGRHC